MSSSKKDLIVTAIPSVPVTVQRPPFKDWHNVKDAGVPRADTAITEASPNGAQEPKGYTDAHRRQSVLQQHCDFFDLNGDGVVTPWETFIGFRLLSWPLLLALFAAVVIHSGFSYVTLPPGRWLPDPLFRIHLAQINSGKHGSDSGTYDHEGRFRAQQFADFFNKYGERLDTVDGAGDFGMTYSQALKGVKAQRCVMDLFGIFAATFEWTATYITIWPEDGIMRLEDVRGIFDGSYFYKTAGARRAAYLSPKKSL